MHLAENISGVSLTEPGSTGSGAVVDLGVCYSYLSFGVSLGDTDFENGYGIRYLPGPSLVQIRSSDTDGWVALTNKFGVSGLTDVSASSPNSGDLLIMTVSVDGYLPESAGPVLFLLVFFQVVN